MESLKLDLNNVGKSKYLYNEVFTIKDYQTFRNSELFNNYFYKLKDTANAQDKLNTLSISKLFWLVPLSICFMFIQPFANIAALMFIVAIILGIIITNKTYKELKADKNKLEKELDDLSLDNPYIRYFYISKDYSSYHMLFLKFKRFNRFLDKLNSYEDVTVYKLEKELSYPTDNYNHHYKNLLFKDNTTGIYFTYAYLSSINSSDEEIVKLMTIFDVNSDTFEYTPRI